MQKICQNKKVLFFKKKYFFFKKSKYFSKKNSFISEIAYGTLSGGSTMTFFRDSKIDVYKKVKLCLKYTGEKIFLFFVIFLQMWKYMESSKPSVFVRDYDQGIARVKRGGYAFLMESTVLDYVVQRDCNLTQIGGLLDSKGKKYSWRRRVSIPVPLAC